MEKIIRLHKDLEKAKINYGERLCLYLKIRELFHTKQYWNFKWRLGKSGNTPSH